MNRINLRHISFSSSITIILIIIWLITIDNATSLFVATPIIGYSFLNNDTTNVPTQQTVGINHVKNGTYDFTSYNNSEEERIGDTTIPNSLSSSSVSGPDNNSCVYYDSPNRTIYLCGGSTNLSTIDRIINSSDVLNNTSDKNWILNANISIENGATLFINSTDTLWLKISSTGSYPHSIIAYGNLVINGTRITPGIHLATPNLFLKTMPVYQFLEVIC